MVADFFQRPIEELQQKTNKLLWAVSQLVLIGCLLTCL